METTRLASGNCPDATEQHFTGKEHDAESGNDYFGARYYASTLGRFMRPDWAAKAEPVPYAKLDDPQSLDLYDYMRNDPLSGVDPDGHCCWDQFVKVVSDTAVGGVKGAWNQVAGVATAINGPIDATLRAAGVSFQFGAAPTASASTPGQQSAMYGVAAVAIAAPTGDLSEGAKLLGAADSAAEKVGISMTEAVDKAASHVEGGIMEETGKGTNYQFRNTTTDASGNTVSKIGRFDINPADPHVAADGPHLNLETHVNGEKGPNEHTPIDPSTIRPGDHP